MRLGGAALLAAAVLALLAIGEQARNSQMAERMEPAVRASESAQVGPSAHAVTAGLDALDPELERLLARMNEASGVDKMDAMAGVINALVRERAELRRALAALRKQPQSSAGVRGEH
ncbi:MAG: hypothetical protein ACM3ZB_07875 [bacterium]|jgi:hypothetical protein